MSAWRRSRLRLSGSLAGAFSAIQRTTAAGICTALDLVAQDKLPQKGFVGQEAVALQDFLGNRFGQAYATECAGEAVAA